MSNTLHSSYTWQTNAYWAITVAIAIGSLEILTPTDLKFGPLAGTKMMCQNMELSNQFNANLARVRSYKIEVLQLFMYDEDGTELLVFKKVD